jgi:hypothetical protein
VLLFQIVVSINEKYPASNNSISPTVFSSQNRNRMIFIILIFVKKTGNGKFPKGRFSPRISKRPNDPEKDPNTGFPFITGESGAGFISLVYKKITSQNKLYHRIRLQNSHNRSILFL